MLPNPEIKEVALQDYVKIIQKRIKLIITFLLVIPSAVTILVFSIKPVYRASVTILIEKATLKVTKFEEVTSTQAAYRDMQYYQTQYKILTSRTLIERVFEELKLSKDADFRSAKDPIEKLLEEINIEPIKNSQIVLAHVEDINSLRAASIANALAKAYIRQDIETRGRATKEAAGWLELQLTDLKKRMQQSEEALNKYIQENRIVTVPDIDKKAATLIDTLKKDKSDIEAAIAKVSKRYKPKHPKMITLNLQLEEVNKKIESETSKFLDLNQKMVQYNLLKKDVESNQQLYTSLLTRGKETDISEKLELTGIRVIDSAKPPEKPYRPKKAISIVMSIFISLFFGIALAFFLEHLDSSIRTAEDVSMYLNLPFLGYVPSVGKEANTDIEKSLLCYQKPSSKIAESYRAIRASLLFASPEDRPLKSILITSSLPQEGKSFFASNLSIILCHANERVILIDMDMRRPKIHKSFNFEHTIGLSNFLTGNADLKDIIKTVPNINNLFLITAGAIPPNPSELLSSGKMRTLLEELKSKYDRIIIDSPPILSVADTSLLANAVEGVILLVKGGQTRLEVIVRSKNKILEAKGKLVGVVVNNIEPEREDRYYYHYYYGEEGTKKQT